MVLTRKKRQDLLEVVEEENLPIKKRKLNIQNTITDAQKIKELKESLKLVQLETFHDEELEENIEENIKENIETRDALYVEFKDEIQDVKFEELEEWEDETQDVEFEDETQWEDETQDVEFEDETLDIELEETQWVDEKDEIDERDNQVAKQNDRYSKEATILNHKFDKQLVNEIVQKSIRELVKKFKNEELESENGSEIEKEDIYERFLEHMDSIHSGTFFERVPLEDREKELKKTVSKDEIKKLNDYLSNLKKQYFNDSPSIIEILRSDKTDDEKKKLLEQLHSFVNSEMMSQEYHAFLNPLLKNKTINVELQQLENELIKASTISGFSDDYKLKILQSEMSFQNKVIAYSKLQAMENHQSSEENISQQMWLDNLLRVPFNKFSGNDIKRDSLSFVKTKLDEKLSFLEKPKDQIINITAQMYKNKNANINAIGIYGPRGTGKTSIIASFAEALNRPYRIIPLGGESDSTMLSGNLKTYIGSSPGRIIEILNETKCMNPIILFDELDKVSDDIKGKEIISTLIHLTDHTTNGEFSGDKYFSGINFDLSKVLFVFTYNDSTKIDKILADRLYKIKVEDYKFKEKMEIAEKHITPYVFKEFALQNIEFQKEALIHLVKSTQECPGMRTIKQKIQIIVSRINTLLLTKKEDDIIKLPYSKLQDYYQNAEKEGVIVILQEHINILLLDSTTDEEKNTIPIGMYI